MLTGDEIISLIGLPESDDKVLDFIEALNQERPTMDEDGYSEGIELEDTVGIDLGFSVDRFTHQQKKSNAGGLFLNDIDIFYKFTPLPFSILDSDSKPTIINKIQNATGLTQIYKGTDEDEEDRLYWFNKDQGYWMAVIFEDDEPYEVCEILVKTYEAPSKLNVVKL